jgi:hypothetical protein
MRCLRINRRWTLLRKSLWRGRCFIVRWNKLILFVEIKFLCQVQPRAVIDSSSNTHDRVAYIIELDGCLAVI